MNQLPCLVVVDFSRRSLKALARAAQHSRLNGARLHIVHVIDTLVVDKMAELFRVPVEEVRAQAVRTAEHELKQAVRNAEGAGTVSVVLSSRVEEIGQPALTP